MCHGCRLHRDQKFRHARTSPRKVEKKKHHVIISSPNNNKTSSSTFSTMADSTNPSAASPILSSLPKNNKDTGMFLLLRGCVHFQDECPKCGGKRHQESHTFSLLCYYSFFFFFTHTFQIISLSLFYHFWFLVYSMVMSVVCTKNHILIYTSISPS